MLEQTDGIQLTDSERESLITHERVILQSADDTVILKQLLPEDAEKYFELVDASREHLSRKYSSQRKDITSGKYPDLQSVIDSIIPPEDLGKSKAKLKYRFGIWDGDLMVGSDNLTPLGNGCAELGSWIAKRYTGHHYHYAARGRRLLVDFAFNQLNLDELVCKIEMGNEASRHSVESSGFTLTEEKVGGWIFILRRPQAET